VIVRLGRDNRIFSRRWPAQAREAGKPASYADRSTNDLSEEVFAG